MEWTPYKFKNVKDVKANLFKMNKIAKCVHTVQKFTAQPAQ